MGSLPDRLRIFSHLTKTRFLHIEDSLERRKLRFFIGSFERGRGASSTAYAFLGVDDARVIFSDMSWGKQTDFQDYKGDLDTAMSRVLKIQLRDGKGWIQVQNGPGEVIGGVVRPKGKAAVEIQIPLTIFEARKMGYACLAYLQAWEVGKVISGQWSVSSGKKAVSSEQ